MRPLGTQGVTELRNAVRFLADTNTERTANKIFSDELLNSIIKRCGHKLYYNLAETGVPYYSKKVEFSISEDDDVYVVPEDYYQGLVLFHKEGEGLYTLITSGNLKGVDDAYKTANSSGYTISTDRKYIVLDREQRTELEIIPSNRRVGEYLFEYIPEAPDNIEDLQMYRGWRDFIIYASAYELGIADYNTRQEWKQERDMLEAKIINWAMNRSPNETSKIQQTQTMDETIDDLNSQSLTGFFGRGTRGTT